MDFLHQIHENMRLFSMNFSEHLAAFAFFLKTHYSPIYLLIAVLVLMLLLRFSKTKSPQLATVKNQETRAEHFIPNTDSISGEHPLTTKLDLAKAYIEMGKKNLAKTLLLNVQKLGTEQQKQEAQRLLDSV